MCAAFLERETEVKGVPCRVVELTGAPGEAVFCNLGLLHATAPNLSDEPRFQRVKFLFLQEGVKSTSPADQNASIASRT